MKDYSGWLEAAAEESLKTAIKSSMEVCKLMRKDEDNKDDVDPEKVDMLHHCWEIICSIKKVMSNDVDGPTDRYTSRSTSSSN